MKPSENQIKSALKFELHRHSTDNYTRWSASAEAQAQGVMASNDELKPEFQTLLATMKELVSAGGNVEAVMQVAMRSELPKDTSNEPEYKAMLKEILH